MTLTKATDCATQARRLWALLEGARALEDLGDAAGAEARIRALDAGRRLAHDLAERIEAGDPAGADLARAADSPAGGNARGDASPRSVTVAELIRTLAQVGTEALLLRDLLRSIDESDDDPNRLAAGLTAARRGAGLIGWIADAAQARAGGALVLGGAAEWLAPDLLGWALPVHDAPAALAEPVGARP